MSVINLKEITPDRFVEAEKGIMSNRTISLPISISHISYLVIGILIGYYIGKRRNKRMEDEYELF